MEASLKGILGPGKDVRLDLRPGAHVSFGRTSQAQVRIPGDRFLSGLHFTLQFQDGQLWLFDMESRNGTFVNGACACRQQLQHCDLIAAGQSTFKVHLAEPNLDPATVLLQHPGHKYAVLDTAVAGDARAQLYQCGAQFWCLYSGDDAAKLEHVAPYLVYLPPDGELLRWMVAQGWGKAWGIFLTSDHPPDVVWHQLRRSLMVGMEGEAEPVYFRFYDPRVLRAFWGIADIEQRGELAGPITAFLMEDEEPDTLLRLLPGSPPGPPNRIHVAMGSREAHRQ